MRVVGRSPRFLLPLCLAPALAGPAEDAAAGLFDRSTDARAAARAWSAAKLEPEEALRLVRAIPRIEAPTTDHDVTLREPGAQETDCRLVFPKDGPDEQGRYGVVVLLHGLGGSSKQGLEIGAAMAPPHAILVAPSAKTPPGDGAGAEDLRTSGAVGIPVMKRFKHWWSYREDGYPLLALEHVRRRYPIDPNKVLLVGYSMGGFGTWNVGLRYHDLWAGIVPMAGGISREEFVLGRDEVVRQLLDNARGLPLFFVHGDEDEVVSVQFDRWSRDDLEKRQIPFTYIEVEHGKHVLTDFLKPDDPRVIQLRDWLRDRVRDPHPRRVVHRSLGAYHPGAFWVRIDDRSGSGGTACVVAEALDKTKVAVETRGVKKLTLFLDPAVVDPKKTIQVAVDGKLAFKGKVKPSLEAVAESFARTRDPELTYQHMLTIDVEPRPEAPGEADGSWLKPPRKS